MARHETEIGSDIINNVIGMRLCLCKHTINEYTALISDY